MIQSQQGKRSCLSDLTNEHEPSWNLNPPPQVLSYEIASLETGKRKDRGYPRLAHFWVKSPCEAACHC
jgi:hypothetical protein